MMLNINLCHPIMLPCFGQQAHLVSTLRMLPYGDISITVNLQSVPPFLNVLNYSFPRDLHLLILILMWNMDQIVVHYKTECPALSPRSP